MIIIVRQQSSGISAKIYNIQRFSIYDGPGVRTVFFFKGCNLHCLWCHNPESICHSCELEFNPDKCIGCGFCFTACPYGAHGIDDPQVELTDRQYDIKSRNHYINREQCVRCFSCVDGCYAEALRCIGQEVDAEYILRTALEDMPYYGDEGGVTFSGGECMLQTDSLAYILKALKKHNIHTAVDTAGSVAYKEFQKILSYTDLILYDIKAINKDLHQKLTGVENGLILENFEKLLSEDIRIIVRIPFIPGLNADEIEAIGDYLSGKNIIRADLLPYHNMGNAKFTLFGRKSDIEIKSPDPAAVENAIENLRRRGINTSV